MWFSLFWAYAHLGMTAALVQVRIPIFFTENDEKRQTNIKAK